MNRQQVGPPKPRCERCERSLEHLEQAHTNLALQRCRPRSAELLRGTEPTNGRTS